MYTLLWLKLFPELKLLASGFEAENFGEISDKSHLHGLPKSISVSFQSIFQQKSWRSPLKKKKSDNYAHAHSVTKSCPTLLREKRILDCGLPGSIVHGISQARILE